MTSANGKHVGHILTDYIHEFGAPAHLTYDGTVVQVGKRTKFQKTLQKTDTKNCLLQDAPTKIHLKLQFMD